MKYELLLRWVSERGTGTWSEFRDAHDWLVNSGQQDGKQVRAATSIHTLSMLGHLEMNWDTSIWDVAPPALTILPNAGAHAILTGGRTLQLLNAFREATSSDQYFSESHKQDWGPDAIFVAAGSDETAVNELAKQIGIAYEVCVSERLAELLPTLDSYLALCRSTPAPSGYGVERFDLRMFDFHPCRTDSEPGFYSYDVWGRPEFRFVSTAGAIFKVDRALGVYAELARTRKNHIRYEAECVNGMLVLPFGAQLPVLQARTAVLCSGLMPYLKDGMWRYVNVPKNIAIAIARSLDQQLLI